MDAPTFTPEQKLKYLAEKLAVVVTEIRAVTGLPWRLEAHLFNGENFPEMTAAASACGIRPMEWSASPKGGFYKQITPATELTIYDNELPHAAEVPADDLTATLLNIAAAGAGQVLP